MTSATLGTARISEKAKSEGCEVASRTTELRADAFRADACFTYSSISSACFCSISIFRVAPTSPKIITYQKWRDSSFRALRSKEKKLAIKIKNKRERGQVLGSFVVRAIVWSWQWRWMQVYGPICNGSLDRLSFFVAIYDVEVGLFICSPLLFSS